MFAKWPWEPSSPIVPPELKIELPEAVKAILEGAVQSAYQAGLLHGAIGGFVALLAIWAVFGKK